MAYPTDTGEYLLDTDASDVAIGAVLSQTQGGKLCTIAYASRSLNKAERKYCVTRKELLAIDCKTSFNTSSITCWVDSLKSDLITNHSSGSLSKGTLVARLLVG